MAVLPVLLGVSKYFDEITTVPDPTTGYFSYVGTYFSDGFACLFDMQPSISPHDEQCHFSSLYILGYCASLILFQMALTLLMTQR